MSASPLVSVVLDAGHGAALRRTIRGVLRQTFHELELIVAVPAQDAAGIRSALEDCTEGDVRVCVTETVPGLRPLDSALAETRGAWVALACAQDEWLLDRLRQQMLLMRALGDPCVAVFGRVLRHSRGAAPAQLSAPALPNSRQIDPAADISADAALMRSGLFRRRALQSLQGLEPGAQLDTRRAWMRDLRRDAIIAAVPDVVAVNEVTSRS